MKHSISLLGIPFLPLTEKDARRRIAKLLQTREPTKVYTPNPQILWQAHQDPRLTRLLRRADLLLPDGVGVILASRLARTKPPLPERITGIDTASWLLRYGAKKELTFYFLGGKRGVAKEAARRMSREIPHLRVVGTHHGYFEKSGKENEWVLAEIRQKAPDVLFVCFGFSEQETWIDRYAQALPSLRLAMGLGGTLDVWSGTVKRAPKAVQTMGMEWLWRAVNDPKRLKSLTCLPKFLLAATRTRGGRD